MSFTFLASLLRCNLFLFSKASSPTSSHYHYLHRKSRFPVPSTPKYDIVLTDIHCLRIGLHSNTSPLSPFPRISEMTPTKHWEQHNTLPGEEQINISWLLAVTRTLLPEGSPTFRCFSASFRDVSKSATLSIARNPGGWFLSPSFKHSDPCSKRWQLV